MVTELTQRRAELDKAIAQGHDYLVGAEPGLLEVIEEVQKILNQSPQHAGLPVYAELIESNREAKDAIEAIRSNPALPKKEAAQKKTASATPTADRRPPAAASSTQV